MTCSLRPTTFDFSIVPSWRTPKLSADDLASPDLLNRIHILWGVESIVTGVVQIASDHYLVTVALRKAASGAVIATASQKLPYVRILDLLNPEGAVARAAAPRSVQMLGQAVHLLSDSAILRWRRENWDFAGHRGLDGHSLYQRHRRKNQRREESRLRPGRTGHRERHLVEISPSFRKGRHAGLGSCASRGFIPLVRKPEGNHAGGVTG
jgi:hypothetical protein